MHLVMMVSNKNTFVYGDECNKQTQHFHSVAFLSMVSSHSALHNTQIACHLQIAKTNVTTCKPLKRQK